MTCDLIHTRCTSSDAWASRSFARLQFTLTFAAPNRAQANPYFFNTSTIFIAQSNVGNIYFSPNFGYFYFPYGEGYLNWIHKIGFGRIYWWGPPYEDTYGGWFWDHQTASNFYTDARYYSIQFYQAPPLLEMIKYYTFYTYFKSQQYNNAWLLYYDTFDLNDYRYFSAILTPGPHGLEDVFEFPNVLQLNDGGP